ncbi:hypothetical protein OS493_039750, partial [Desmophyllum pertusum]
CLLPLGVADSRVIPDNSITVSSNLPGYPANEARLNSVQGWCASEKRQKNQFVQIDLGQTKKLSAVIQKGTDTGDVTGYFLQYSLDGQRWTMWSSKSRNVSICYHGKCAASVDTQCRDLWGPDMLHVVSCNAIQQDRGQWWIMEVIMDTGEKCRKVTRKGGAGNELVGMVKEGTVCGNNMDCTNQEKCHCQGNLDPEDCLSNSKTSREGRWVDGLSGPSVREFVEEEQRQDIASVTTRHQPTGDETVMEKGSQEQPCNNKKCPAVHSCQHLMSLGKTD